MENNLCRMKGLLDYFFSFFIADILKVILNDFSEHLLYKNTIENFEYSKPIT